MLTGILYPDSGHIKVIDIDPTKKKKQLAYKIGLYLDKKNNYGCI
jgi:ABC-2 type transport system ATP-binding protein